MDMSRDDNGDADFFAWPPEVLAVARAPVPVARPVVFVNGVQRDDVSDDRVV
jgi:hypothetical protein